MTPVEESHRVSSALCAVSAASYKSPLLDVRQCCESANSCIFGSFALHRLPALRAQQVLLIFFHKSPSFQIENRNVTLAQEAAVIFTGGPERT